MSEEPAQIAREAKGLQQGLKESLKTREPWDREVEFQRKNLRRQYLRLLFVHPYAAESKDVETHLWMTTSYQFISKYKERIAALDRTINGSPRQQQQQQQQSRQHGSHGPVEYRKLLQRFRQFLSEEEKFWILLIVHIRRSFSLDSIDAVLAALDIAVKAEATVPSEGAAPKRNQHQFPPEADAVSLSPVAAQRESMIAVLSKALVCLGDIARYKEQYNEAGGRPRAGHEDGPPAVVPTGKNGRNRRGGAGGAISVAIPRMRNYDRAQSCYEQARLLLPNDGNPSHQLAILASYQKDTFESLVHYYRALCVRTPYDTASENMGTTLSKALDQWKVRGSRKEREREKEEARGAATPLAPRLRVEGFKEKLIVLHALWRLPSDEIETTSPNLTQKVIDEFRALVSGRMIPDDMILKVVVLAQAALWKHRTLHHPSVSNGPTQRVTTELHIATHLLALHRTLLEVGTVQIAEPPPQDAGEHDLAQHITATFRRMLPALRMAGKWVRANFKYILQNQRVQAMNGERLDASDGLEKRRERERDSMRFSGIADVPSFWKAYTQFSSSLLRAFPFEKLPNLSVPLDEDVNMVGFLPLQRVMTEESALASSGKAVSMAGEAPAREEVHPNEEQLMRIKDLIKDAQALAGADNSPIKLSDNSFILKKDVDETGSLSQITSDERIRRSSIDCLSRVTLPAMPSTETRVDHLVRQTTTDADDDNMTETTRTDDDPVRDAFRQALNGSGSEDEEEMEDEIVLYPKPNLQSRADAIIVAAPASPTRSKSNSPLVPTFSPHGTVPTSPQFQMSAVDALPSPGPKASTTTTAQDLLMGLQRTSHSRVPSVPQAQLLFGSGSLSGSTASIWSTVHDGYTFSRQGNTRATTSSLHHSQPSYGVSSQVPVSSFPSHGRQNNVLESAMLSLSSQHSLPFVNGGHHRTSSQSIARSQGLPSQFQDQLYSTSGPYLPPAETTSSLYSTGVPAAFSDPIFPVSSHSMLHQQYPPGYRTQSLLYHHEPRAEQGASGLHAPLPSSMSQLWMNPG
ncbi:hypothetical protein AcV5_009826 [Taiwanofungus camphoratus]|nr:hypothetical protein AcV5_009826 [Antrodia cinnamomea]KAI0926506.1 hypothetical protein AcV7_005425 [Antrodia cinnamomea]